MAIDLSRLRKAIGDDGSGDNGSQTLRGNGSSQPRIKRDEPTVRNARRDAIRRMTDAKGEANSPGRRAMRNARTAEALSPINSKSRGSKDTGPEDAGIVDSPFGRRGDSSRKKNPAFRVN